MEQLPFLVVYGAWVWKVVGVAFVAGGYATWSGVRRSRFRRRARRLRERVGTPTAALGGVADGTEVVLEGRLRSEQSCERYIDGGEAAAVSFWWLQEGVGGDGARRSIHRRARDLVVETDSGPVTLTGNVEVLVGSTERPTPSRDQIDAARVRLEADAEEGETPDAWSQPSHRWVCDGDRVIARGVLRRAAQTDARPADYRADAGAMSLDGGDDDARIGLAFAGAGSLGAPSIPLRAGVVAGSMVLFLLASHTLGSCAVKQSQDRGYSQISPDRPFALPSVDWLAIAAATPFHRGKALERIERELLSYNIVEQAHLDAAVAVAELRGDCELASGLLENHNQHREALAHDERCSERDWLMRANAHAALAEFEAASDAVAQARAADPDGHRSVRHLAVHVLARNWSRAADEARWHARRWRNDNQPRSGIWACLAMAFDAKAGKPEALDEMSAARDPGAREACTLLRAELTGHSEDVGILIATPMPDGEIGNAYVGHELTIAQAFLVFQHRPELIGDDSLLRVLSTPPPDTLERTDAWLNELGLVARVVDKLPELSSQQPRIARSLWALLVQATAHAGATDTATQHMASARASLPASDPVDDDAFYYWLRVGQPGRAAEVIRRSSLVSLWDWIPDAIEGDIEPYVRRRLWSQGSVADVYRPLADNLTRAASTRDGADLATAARSMMSPGWEAVVLLAPHMDHNRDALRDIARLSSQSMSITRTPWLGDIGARLVVAEASGDEALIAEYRALARRHYDAVTDPELAMLLYLLGM